ncbi:MAG TPA: histidine kinase dimerization/phospho-acceptor domain-containing protein [Acidobacteriaceae bacterium]
MARLLLKIFLAYWIAAGAIILLFDLGPHRHMHNPQLADALDASIVINGSMLAAAYESGGCAATQKSVSSQQDGLYLAAPDGRLLCGDPHLADAASLVKTAAAGGNRMIASHTRSQLIAIPYTAGSGAQYVILLKNTYSTALQIYGLLPGSNTIAISCGVTLFLALLMALPIRRLRAAAGEIAMGRLDTRVRWDSPTSRFTGGDDIDQLCRDFNHMAERLQSLADAQRLLLCEVSHELRSPLARLGVALSLARSESSPAMREHLDRIRAEATRLNHLIDQVLSLSRLDMLSRPEAPCWFSASELVADALPDLEFEAAQSDSHIEVRFDSDCSVYGDAELLRMAIENIVRNAIKYAGHAGLVHLQVRHADDGSYVFRVTDNGPGIPEHELSSVLRLLASFDRVLRHYETWPDPWGTRLRGHRSFYLQELPHHREDQSAVPRRDVQLPESL